MKKTVQRALKVLKKSHIKVSHKAKKKAHHKARKTHRKATKKHHAKIAHKKHTVPLPILERKVKAAKRNGCLPIVLFKDAVRDLVTRERDSKRTAKRWRAKAQASTQHAAHLGKIVCQITGDLKCAKQIAKRGAIPGLNGPKRPAHSSCEDQKQLEAYRAWVKDWSELSAHEQSLAYHLRMKAKFQYKQVCEITGDKTPYSVAEAEFLRISESEQIAS